MLDDDDLTVTSIFGYHTGLGLALLLSKANKLSLGTVTRALFKFFSEKNTKNIDFIIVLAQHLPFLNLVSLC